MKFQASLGIALLALAPTHGAAAAECGPLKIVNQVQLLTSTGSYQEMVPATINGASKLLLLDTGGYMSQVSEDTAKELKLEQHSSEGLRLYDVSGSESRYYVIADSLQIGALQARRHPMMVWTGLGFDGILSTDLMLLYDVDIDFGSGLMRYFSPDHCPGNVVYWNPPAVAAVPITIPDRSSIVIPVKLDDREFRAVVDTGATRTVISTNIAKSAFGLTPVSPDVKRSEMPVAIRSSPALPMFSIRSASTASRSTIPQS